MTKAPHTFFDSIYYLSFKASIHIKLMITSTVGLQIDMTFMLRAFSNFQEYIHGCKVLVCHTL